MYNIQLNNHKSIFIFPKYQTNKNSLLNNKCKKITDIERSFTGNYKNYCLPFISFGSQNDIDKDKLKSLNIPNYQYIGNNNVRGESLSSKKNRKFLFPVKKAGIKNIIDLREKYSSQTYDSMCENLGLNYFPIPIDSESVSDREIIQNMPVLFKTLNEGRTYIACAQGLHRTDIALAVNYIFNPKKQVNPPIMYGHFRNFGFKFDDISRRLNSLKKQMTQEDIINIGWNDTQEFDTAFLERKKQLKEYNTELVEKFNIYNE